MKFIADENIATRTVVALREQGFDVISIYEEKLFRIPDEKIINLAKKQKRIVLTHDKDFDSLIHQFSPPPCRVILLRLRNQSPNNVIKHLPPFLKKVKPEKIKNRLVIFREGQVRII